MDSSDRLPVWSELRADLAALHRAALAAADPGAAVARWLELTEAGPRVGGELLPFGPDQHLWLVAAGKAARGMANAAWQVLGARVAGGVVVHPHGAPVAADEPDPWPERWRLMSAAHPLPDEGSLAAGEAVRSVLCRAGAGDLVLVLLSGGASSLLEALRPGLSLVTLRGVTELLQHAGADITELNTVRRSLSLLKGGGLARLAAPARVVTLAISDVVGDSPEAIGSGPTVPSSTGPSEALGILDRYALGSRAPEVMAVLQAAAAEPPAGEFPAGLFRLAASNRQAAESVVRAAELRGFKAHLLTTFLAGEAREVGRMVGGFAAGVRAQGLPFTAPACLVFGGETTVRVEGRGRGGRNLELALGAAKALAGHERVAVLAFASDGLDGNSGAAGALATGETLARAAALGLDTDRPLAENDTAPFFEALGDLWPGGATGTNVNDLAVVLVYP